MASQSEELRIAQLLGDLSHSRERIPFDALAELIGMGAPAVEPLLGLLHEIEPDEDDWTPLWIAVALGELRAPEAVPALLRLLALPEGDVLAETAGEALAKIGAPALGPLMTFAREAREWEARHYAYAVIGQIPGEASLRFLIGALDRDPLLWTALAIALADLGDSQGAPALKAILPRCEEREAGPVREALEILAGNHPPYPKSHVKPWRQRCEELVS